MNEKYHKITAEALEALTLPDEVKTFIHENWTAVTEDGQTYYKVSDDTFDSADLDETVKSFIYSNSTEKNEEYYVMKDENIKYVQDQDTNEWKIVVEGLQEISSNGTARTYALKPKTTVKDGYETVNNIPVNQVASKLKPYSGASDDSYIPLATNTGVCSNVVDKAYNGAELSLTLTGKTEFRGPLQWADKAKQSERINAVNGETAGDFILYRYVDTGDNANDSKYVAQVGTWKIDSGDEYIYKDGSNTWIDKYDNTGSEYFYYAKEHLTLEEYKTDYIYPSGLTVPDLIPFNNGPQDAEYNGSPVFSNGAVVKNSLTGEIGFGVDAEWIAAELQGGTGSIDYQLQYFDTSDNTWKNCTIGDTADPNQIKIKDFSAEQMEKYMMFESVRKYDEAGNLIKYRVVQTNISRTDNGKTGSNPMQINMGYDASGKATLLDEHGDPTDKVIITINEADGNTYKFEVTLEWDPETATFYYDYKLIGDVRIVMNKDWDPVPIDQLDNVRNAKVKLQLMKYNYATGKYEKYDAARDNAGNIKYTDDSAGNSVHRIFSTNISVSSTTVLYVKNGDNYEPLSGVTLETLYEKDGISYVQVNGSIPDDTSVYIQKTNNEYVELTPDKSGIFVVERTDVVEGVKNVGEKHYAIKLLNVPMYDNEGRLNRFTLEEVGITPETDTSAVYSSYIDQDPMVFTAQNIFGEGGEEIHFHKIWMDDGEEEYKKPVTVYMPARAMQLPFPSGGKNLAPDNWEDMDETKLAEELSKQSQDTSSGWHFQDLWTQDTRYQDLLSGAGIGYHYLAKDNNSNISVPKKYYGYSALQTVNYKAEVDKGSRTGKLTVKLQRKAENTSDAFVDVRDANIRARSNFPSRQYTSDSSGSITMHSNEVIDNKYSILLKNLYINKVEGSNSYPYTYTIETNTGESWNIQKQETANSDGTTKNILVTATTTDNTLTQFTFKIKRSYNDGTTTVEEYVSVVNGERQLDAKTYAPAYGQYKIDPVDGKYYFQFSDLESGYDYQLVDENNTPITNNNTSPQETITKNYYYTPYSDNTNSEFKLPLSANSYYYNAVMNAAEQGKRDALSTLLENVKNSNSPYLLNTNHNMNEENVWTARVQVRIGYSYHPRTSDNSYGYDLRDFAEHIKSDLDDQNEFIPRTDLNGSGMSASKWMTDVQPASDAWISMLPAQYSKHFYAVSDDINGVAASASYSVVDASGNKINGDYASTVDTTSDPENKKYKVVVVADNTGSDFVFKLQPKDSSADVGTLHNIDNTKTYSLKGGVYTIPETDAGEYNVVNMSEKGTTTGADYSYQTENGKTVDPTKYEWLSGIYKAVYSGGYERYYAVQEIPCQSAINGGRLSDLDFQNTRIGIVNYRIHFDWNVGTKLSEMKNVTLEIEADYHDGSDPHIVKFNDNEQITLNLLDGVNDYYITNLPKYTPTGQVITYTVREVGINGVPFDKRGKCTLGNDNLYATIEEEDYIVNDKSNSDDLMPIVITNSFSGTRDFTVNKIWLDDTNTLNTRTDLYIQLWKHSTKTQNAPADSQVGKDYLWRKYSYDSDNHWSFTYDGLPTYDSGGYRYEYYVKELSENFKKNDYETYYNNASHIVAINSNDGNKQYTSNDSVFTIPQEDISGGNVSVTISGVDSEDIFYDGANKTYDFRVLDTNGEVMNNAAFTHTDPTDDHKMDLTISFTGVPSGKELVFRLQRKVNDAKAEYEYNTTYLTAVSNAHPPITYRSSNGAFSVSNTAVAGTQGFSLTISGLDKYDKDNHEYEYRAVRRINGKYGNNSISCSQADESGYSNRVTVTVTPLGQSWLGFKLQRKLKDIENSEWADFNGQWELIDDMWRDMPDFYQFEGSTHHNDHDYYPGLEGATEANGRAYDNGTITNKLVGKVEIDVKKLWQSIDPKFESQNYPIADVFLYANIKSHQSGYVGNTESAQGKDFDQGGYTITGRVAAGADKEDALGELMNILQISYTAGQKPGEVDYKFTGKRTIVKNEQDEIQYQGNTDYVQFDDTIGKFDGSGSARLEKYDENGALINYNIRERAINGYTYRISNDTIINEYNGGDRVAVKVTKTWKNMDIAAKFPTVKFNLYQCYVGKNKTTDEYELKTYNIFTETIRAVNKEPVSYVFGTHDKDILYKLSPTGEEFFYYVTEELIDANGQGRVSFRKKYTVNQLNKSISVPEVMTYTYDANASTADKMVLTDDVKLAGLGFTCTITEAENNDNDPDIPYTIPICKSVTVTNDYSPQEENFKSTITIDKNWELYDKNTVEQKQNPLNAKEFENINNYGFTLKRRTKYIPEESLFHVTTGTVNSSGGEPTIDGLITSSEFNITAGPFKCMDSNGTETNVENDIVYYQSVLTVVYPKENNRTIYVYVKVDKATKQVTIEGMAIYGEDGLLYTYIVEEDDSPTNVFSPEQRRKQRQIEPIYDRSVSFTATQETELKFKLQRRVKAADGQQSYTDVTAAMLNSENIVAVDNASTHTFTPVNGLYSIPAEFAQPDGQNDNQENVKKFIVTISGLDSGYEYIASDGEYLSSSKDGKINMLVTKTGVPESSTAPFTFYVKRRPDDTSQYTNVTESLPPAVYASEYVHKFSYDSNGVFTVPEEFAENNEYSVKLNNLPQKCSKGEYEYLIVNANTSTVYNSTSEDGIKVVGGMVEMGLDNNLKVFTFRLNKIFGAEYTVDGVTKYKDIPEEDYKLYFKDDEFLSRLKYTLQRKTAADSDWENYINLNVDQNPSHSSISTHTDSNNLYSDITAPLEKYDSGKNMGKYYYAFRYLPVMNASGDSYQYRVVEHEDSVGEYVKIYYPASDSSDTVPADNTAMQDSTDDFSFVLQYSTDNGSTYSNITNLNPAAAPSISVTGATYSAPTVTVPRANANGGNYSLTVSGLPKETSDGTPKAILYRINYVKGGIEATVSSDDSGTDVNLSISAKASSKYFFGNNPVEYTASPGSWQEAYVRNIFVGKEIILEKRWDDNKNADGLRPEKLDLELHEKVLSINGEEEVTKTLENKDHWKYTVVLPRYYYNGDLPLDNVQFYVTEDPQKALQYYTSGDSLETIGYKQSDQGYIVNDSGTLKDEPDGFNGNLKGTQNDNFVGLYIVNHKELVNSQLTFEKQWNDNQNEQKTRPDSIYIKTLRRTKGSIQPDKDGFFTVNSSEVDFSQITLLQNLPLYYKVERKETVEGQETTVIGIIIS